MSDNGSFEKYLNASQRLNTKRSYAGGVKHFEVMGDGFLPATPTNIAEYLAQFAETLSIATLSLRLAALADWHVEHGFADPTKDNLVRQVFRGIKAMHQRPQKRVQALAFETLEQVVASFETSMKLALARRDLSTQLRNARDKAIFFVGFWKGLRSDELARLSLDNFRVVPGEGMVFFLPITKTDRRNEGSYLRVPALSKFCPVEAVEQWLALSELSSGPLFRSIDRWGNIGGRGLSHYSLAPIMRSSLANVRIPANVTGHSGERDRCAGDGVTRSNSNPCGHDGST